MFIMRRTRKQLFEKICSKWDSNTCPRRCQMWWCYLLSYRGKRSIDYPAQGKKPYNSRPFARVLYVFLIKDILVGRWLPWVPTGPTRRCCKDDVVHNNSAHRYYITRIEGGVRHACMILLHVEQHTTKLSKKCHPYNTRIGSGHISYARHSEWWWDEQNRCTYDNIKATSAWYSQQHLQ